ncbi:type II toxin-antitoxin system RelB/DinJ family antitoxin [Abyssogena phaseoliformis symbiont]|uniref:type II toxin-antitoxin system RelB/DinJ family antitoxin n=1 Tax=Abyssogena phaseoliformis symbiont TaxID=596095 RepID=UPI003CCA2092
MKLFVMVVINSGSIPFKLIAKQSNQETIKAMQELESGNGIKVGGVKALFKELDVEM